MAAQPSKIILHYVVEYALTPESNPNVGEGLVLQVEAMTSPQKPLKRLAFFLLPDQAAQLGADLQVAAGAVKPERQH